MQTMELFAGTQSFSKIMKKYNHKTLTVDINPDLNPDICSDIMNLNPENYKKKNVDLLWASPPCTSFSVASMSHHWHKFNGVHNPKTDDAILGLRILEKTVSIIKELQPRYYIIENPRGIMRFKIVKFLNKYGLIDFHRTTVSYCQYGDKRMKPTDLWTNIPGYIGRICKNNGTCHERAPRGSKTGTQGLKNAKDRGVIPEKLFIEILEYINKITIKEKQMTLLSVS